MTAAVDQPQLDRKTFATLSARAALAGWQLWRSDPFAGRWGMVMVLGNLEEVEQFLAHVGTTQ